MDQPAMLVAKLAYFILVFIRLPEQSHFYNTTIM